MESEKILKSQRCCSHTHLWVSIGALAVLLSFSTGLTVFTLFRYCDLRDEVLKFKSAIKDGSVASHDELMNHVEVSEPDMHHRVKRDVTDKLADLPIESIWNMRGPPGRDGRDGKDGVDGVNGRDGRDGVDGQNCNCSTSTTSQTNAVSKKSGSTYVRWGRTACGTNSSLLYQGFAAGQHYTETGGSAEYICLPLTPQYNQWTTSSSAGSYIYGAEFETKSFGIFPSSAQDKNVPCSQCYSSRSATLMIPARKQCPNAWTKEYEGYLMTGGSGDAHPYNYICADSNPEFVAGTESNTNGATLFFVSAYCSSTFHCPPYINHAEITCVVCTK